MKQLGPDNLMLLFYDGHEQRAEPTLVRRIPAELRRHIRHIVRSLQRRQVKSGFRTSFGMLCDALKQAGCKVRVNDFSTARRYPDHPIGVGGYPSVFAKLESLPNPRIIGPGVFTSPLDYPNLMDDPRNVFFLERCDWHADLYRPYYGDQMRRWYAGFDVNRIVDAKTLPKSYDVLIYDKIYFDRDQLYAQTVEPFIRHLESKGHSYVLLKYGTYRQEDYEALLKKSRSMAFFCQAETQGMGYQNCLAMNIPIFAWDEGIWTDPHAKRLSSEPIACTSVPFFDETCGERFKVSNMIEAWDRFWPKLETYQPRKYVAAELSLSQSAKDYLAIWKEVKERAAGANQKAGPAARRAAS